MSIPPPILSLVSDPVSLAKIQVLVVPVHHSTGHLSEAIYSHWASLIRRHTTLRGDEIRRPYSLPSANGGGHQRGAGAESNPKLRFFPPPSGTSISKTTSNQHVHLAYPTHPPARHLYPLSLLRIASFPLVVIGIAVDAGGSSEHGQGYRLDEEDEGEASTPQASASTSFNVDYDRPQTPSVAFDKTHQSLFPHTSPFPLVRRLVLVPSEVPSSRSARSSPTKADPRAAARAALERGQSRDGPEVLKAPTEGSESWIGRVLGEVIGDVLSELGETAAALETPSGLKTLSSTLLPSLTSHVAGSAVDSIYSNTKSSTPILELPHRSSTNTPTGSRDTLAPGPSIARALTPGGRPVSVQPPSLPPLQTNVISSSPPVSSASANPFRRSTAIPSPFSRTPSATSVSSSPSAQTSIGGMSTAQKYTSAPLSGLAGGRLMKLLGDMFLLAGMYADAIKCFDDGAERCRAVGDVLWEGLAREGRAVAGIGEAWEGRDGSNSTIPFPGAPIPVEIQNHFLSALACISRAPLPYPPTILSPSPQAVSGSLSFPGPSSGGPTNLGTGEGLLAYLHVNLTLRLAHFMLITWAAGGWGSIALSCLVGHTLPRSFPPLPSSTANPLEQKKRQKELSILSHRAQIPRHEIFEHVESALAPHHQALTKTERIALLVEATWIARWLGLPRKETAVTRILVKRLAMVIVEARDEARRIAGPAQGYGHAGRQAKEAETAVGLGLGMPVPTSRVAVRRKESTEGNGSIIELLERTLHTIGVDTLSFIDGSPLDPLSKPTARNARHYGWPELQVEIMKEAIAISETLPDHASIVRFCLSALNGLYPYLSPPSQAGLAKMFPASLGVIKRRGIEIGQIPWWIPGKIVLHLEVASMSGNRVPREHAREEIAVEDGKKEPFLYNPRPKAAVAGKTVIVANEQVDVFVTVQNPLAFDLEVADLSLLTSGVPLTTSPLPLIIPALSVQTVRVAAIASTAGNLQIKGVALRLHDGSRTEVLLPVIDESEKRKQDKRKSRLSMEGGKVKRSGVDARLSLSTYGAETEEEGEGKWLECVIIEEQPLVWIKKTSLTHGTVMLYHGETTIIRLVLENSSSTPVDLIKLSFDDSTAREAQALMSEGELAPEHAYELDWDQINNPALIWENPNETSIPPGGRATLLVKCLGKIGCTDGSIRVDYGYINRSSSTDSPSRSFHTRQIIFPILFTVYHTFEPHSLDLVRFQPSNNGVAPQLKCGGNGDGKLSPPTSLAVTPRRSSFAGNANVEDGLQRHLKNEADDEHCLVALSVRNVYGVPFQIILERRDDESDPKVSTSRLVPPGSTERLILPIPRILLPPSTLSQPIPSLTDRQYVVDKSRKSPSQINAERELFWYRNALLDKLLASWVEPGSMRTGQLSLRGQALRPNLLEVLKKDEVEIRLSCLTGRHGHGAEVVETTDFTEISATVINRLDRPIELKVTLEPLALSDVGSSNRRQAPTSAALKNLLIDGAVSTVLPALNSGDKGEHVVPVVFLAKGTYAFRAIIQEQGQGQGTGLVKFSSVLEVVVE